jgi:hypothetical protein
MRDKVWDIIMKENVVVNTLRDWNVEANSGYNDGWVQGHYINKIEEVREFLKTIPPKREKEDER